MTLEGGGYRVCVENVGGVAFLHSLGGSGTPSGFAVFVAAVMDACEGAVLMATAEDPKKARFYKRLGFTETGEQMNGHTVLVRFPHPEVQS